jgi:lysozyme
MCFNLGKTRLLAFKRTLLAIAIRDYDNAALYMLQSKWSKQVGNRSIRLAKMMKTGVK